MYEFTGTLSITWCCSLAGPVHSWHFEGEVDGYIVHFNEELFTSFLGDGQYLERFSWGKIKWVIDGGKYS
jgi:hypothetical protein